MSKLVKKILSILGISTVLVLSGCASFFGATQTLPPGGTTTESVASVCDIFTATLKTLTPLKSSMSSGNIATVNASIRLAQPICDNKTMYNSNSAIVAIKAETANLAAILKTSKGVKP